MNRIVLIIEYDGTNYVGWQIQPNGIAVQQVIGNALKKITGENITLHASGRTDSGVHARALNTYLPPDIRIKASLEMPREGEAEFHARFSVQKKYYRYRVLNSRHASAFSRSTALHVHTPLSIEKLNAAAELFIGTHDFAAFKAAGSKAETTVRTIFLSRWSRDGDCIVYDVAGSGFLYNMVRIMVGTMLRIGQSSDDISKLRHALECPHRENAGDTAPAHGLTLWRIEYPEFDTEDLLLRNFLI